MPLDALQEEYTGYALYVAVPGRPQEHVEKLRLAKGKRWFWDVLRYYAPIYRHVALASVIINLIALASPLFAMNVYDRVVPNNAIETLWVLASGVIIIYLFDFLLRALRTHFVDVAGRNADIVLSSNLVDKVLTMRLESKPESTGSLVNNLREFEQLREFFSSSSLRRSSSMSQWVRVGLLISSPSRSASPSRWATEPQRHSHSSGISAPSANGRMVRWPFGHTYATSFRAAKSTLSSDSSDFAPMLMPLRLRSAISASSLKDL